MRDEPPSPAAGAAAGAVVGRIALALWALLTLFSLAYRLGGYPLIEPDEGRNAEVARELQASGDWLLPTLDGLPYLDKPVLFFAAGAAAVELVGPTEWAVRLPALLFTVATVALVACFARRLYGARGAWIAALATAASPLTMAFARTVIFDSALTFFVVLALVAFHVAVGREVAVRAGGGPARTRAVLPWTVLAWAAIGLGVLTKGPVAIVLPLLVAAPYALWRRASKAVWHPLGVAAMLAVAVPWVWAVDRRVPGFLHYALLTETWGRLTTQELRRGGPIWYFLPVLLWGAVPWVVVAAAGGLVRLRGWWAKRRGSPDAVFLLLWVLVPFVFFSLSQSKRPQYVLPLVPAVALLVARWWTTGPGGRLPGARAGAAALLAGGGLLLAAGAAAAIRPDMVRTAPADATATALVLGALSLAAGALAWRWSGRWRLCMMALGLPVLAMPVVTMPVLEQVAAGRSARSLAAAIAPVLPDDGRLLGIEAFSPSLVFYLQRPMLVATADGAPLRSNYIIHDYDAGLATPGSPLRPAAYWQQVLEACERPTVFLADARAAAVRAPLEAAGLPLIGRTRYWAAYGPCRADGLQPRAP